MMNSLYEIEQEFKNYLESIGHPLNGIMKFDTDWQPYPCPHSKRSKTTARYKAHSDRTPTIKFWCARCGMSESFTYKRHPQSKQTASERDTIKRKIEEQHRADVENTKLSLNKMKYEYANAAICTNHKYFDKKQIAISESYGFRVTTNGTLICPIFSISGDLITTQHIYLNKITNEFEKRFFKGLSPKGGFLIFGNLNNHKEVFFAEGIATTIQIHHATDKPAICVYGKHFDVVSKIIQEAYPSKCFIFCCDVSGKNEHANSEDNAKKAVLRVGGKIFLPDFSLIPNELETGIPRSDFNDLHVLLLKNGLDINDAHAEICRQLTAPTVLHNQILKQLVKKIKPINFLTLSGLEDESKITNKHLQIIAIEEILQLASLNSWGICRRHDFIYLFNGAFWRVLDIDELKFFLGHAAEIMSVDKFKARHFSFRDQLYKQFIAVSNIPQPEPQKDTVCINLKNGTFIITPDGTTLQPFNRSDFITYQLSFDYDPLAKAPLFEKYLHRVLPDIQKQQVISEFLGYVFVRATTLKLEKTLMLYGTGANGKSVLYEIVRNLLGEQNTSEYSLQSLTDNKGYHRANLANKLVNYASEISGSLEASIFKQLVSGEPVEARLPYGNPFILSQYAKLIFNCNELPKDVEQTEAYFRRFLIISFDVTIPESEQDKQLAQKIISNELSGVFNWVLAGLMRLLKQKRFTDCDAAQMARKQYEIESDSVRLFLNENEYKPSPAIHRTVKQLYIDYRTFCTDDGYKPVSKNNFKKRLIGSGVIIEKKNIGDVAFID